MWASRTGNYVIVNRDATWGKTVELTKSKNRKKAENNSKSSLKIGPNFPP